MGSDVEGVAGSGCGDEQEGTVLVFAAIGVGRHDVRAALVVTQEFHIRRAVFLCRQAGVASAAPDNDDTGYQVREVPAAIKATFDVLVDADPKYLGSHETGVDKALSTP